MFKEGYILANEYVRMLEKKHVETLIKAVQYWSDRAEDSPTFQPKLEEAKEKLQVELRRIHGDESQKRQGV